MWVCSEERAAFPCLMPITLGLVALRRTHATLTRSGLSPPKKKIPAARKGLPIDS